MIKNIEEAKELVKRYKKFKGTSWRELKDETGIGGTGTCILCRPLLPKYSNSLYPGPKCRNCIWSVGSDVDYANYKHCLNENYGALSCESDPFVFRRVLAERVGMLEERIAVSSNLWKRLLYTWKRWRR